MVLICIPDTHMHTYTCAHTDAHMHVCTQIYTQGRRKAGRERRRGREGQRKGGREKGVSVLVTSSMILYHAYQTHKTATSKKISMSFLSPRNQQLKA